MPTARRTVGVVLLVSAAVVAAPAGCGAIQGTGAVPDRTAVQHTTAVRATTAVQVTTAVPRTGTSSTATAPTYTAEARRPPSGTVTPTQPTSTITMSDNPRLTAAQKAQARRAVHAYRGIDLLSDAVLSQEVLWYTLGGSAGMGEVAVATLTSPLSCTCDLPGLNYSDDQLTVTTSTVRYTIRNETRLRVWVDFDADRVVMIDPIDDSAVLAASPLAD